MMTTFTASAIIPAFEGIAEEFGVSLHKTAYLTSLQIAVLGWAPLFWKPIANRYGRRPVWLISTLGSLAFNIGCAKSNSYATMAICRAFTAFFISPPGGTGSGVVTETFFKKERATYVGMWTLLCTLGPPAGPFFMGFVIYHTGSFRWVYWILAIVSIWLNMVYYRMKLITGRPTVCNSSLTSSLALRLSTCATSSATTFPLSSKSTSLSSASTLRLSSSSSSSSPCSSSVTPLSGFLQSPTPSSSVSAVFSLPWRFLSCSSRSSV
jgi:MFS family permease